MEGVYLHIGHPIYNDLKLKWFFTIIQMSEHRVRLICFSSLLQKLTIYFLPPEPLLESITDICRYNSTTEFENSL